MPRARRTCSTCHHIITTGSRCTTCTRTADRQRRADQPSYGTTAHRRFRQAVLKKDPICVLCRTAWATVADHHPTSRRDLIAAGMDENDPTRGRGLCKKCHDTHTAHAQPGGWNVRIGRG